MPVGLHLELTIGEALVGGWRARERGWGIYSPLLPMPLLPRDCSSRWGPLSKTPALTGFRNLHMVENGWKFVVSLFKQASTPREVSGMVPRTSAS